MNDQPRIMLRDFGNHIHDVTLDHYGATDNPSLLSRHHQYPITYLHWILQST